MVVSYVSYDTKLLASESPVRAMKFTLGTIVTPKKQMASSNYQDWSDSIVNSAIKDLTITKKVNRHTRAGQLGKFIVCPNCNQGNTVFHFAWSALGCQHCNTMVEKNQWRLL